ncbi:DUF4129 domain-containing protein [Tumebacillus flagellatus]|uniref:Protein-glutamine gamma-glutamyltransferase-like C-terminal domain-containing protein n=1 Tax=Tumebacillus flagellatus TaxID=1157490 RepID=A0A074MCC7_9BACL|nr:DUF4129 domain-containing protein [Tumebacillus flagellatus]KEO83537.1 hypothetical protein EL26_08970 [Tumebacillus flagellatus]
MKRTGWVPAVWSVVLGFLTLAVICSGLPENGSRALAVYLGVAGAFLVVCVLPARVSRWMLVYGFAVLVGGVAWLWVRYDGFAGVPTLNLLVWGALLLYRLHQLHQLERSGSQLNYELREQSKVDAGAILALYFVTSIGGHGADDAWRQAVVPFLTAFAGLRLVALSASFQAERQAKLELKERRQPVARLVYLLAGVGLLFWCLNAGGSALRDAVYAVLDVLLFPVVYVVGHVLQFFLERYHIHWAITEIDSQNAANSFDQLGDSGQTVEWNTAGLELTLLILAGVVGGWLLWKLRRGARRRVAVSAEDYVVTTREFMSQPIEAPPSPVWDEEDPTLTEIRRLYREFLQAMERKGFERRRDETPLEFVERLSPEMPEVKTELLELTNVYMRERYGHAGVSETNAEALVEEILKSS